MQKNSDKQERLARAYAGEQVWDEKAQINITVMPMKAGDAVRVLDLCKKSIEMIAPVIEAFLNQSDDRMTNANFVTLIEKTFQEIDSEQFGELLKYLDTCVDVDIEVLPVGMIPPILIAWFKGSFGQGKARGWRALTQYLLNALTSPPGTAATSSPMQTVKTPMPVMSTTQPVETMDAPPSRETSARADSTSPTSSVS